MTTSESEAQDADVVVLGLGVAGLAAAITAHDSGARVIVLEKAPASHSGGNARVSGQAWFSPTDVGAACRHLRAMAGDYTVPDEIIAALCTESARHNDWVAERLTEVADDVAWDAEDPMRAEERRVFRVPYASAAAYAGQELPRDEFWDVEGSDCGTERNMIGGSMGYGRLWRVLTACLAKRGIGVRYGVQATALVRDEGGSVVGVEVTGADGRRQAVRARGLVLATGGFAASRSLTRNYLRLPAAIPYGSPYNTGDGMLLGQQAGADLAHPYNYMALSGIRLGEALVGEHCEVRDGRYILVGGDGRRFIDESLGSWHGKTRLRGGFDFYPGSPMWTIFDEDGRLAGPLSVPRSKYAVGWARMMDGYEWSDDNRAEIDKGWIVEAGSIRELGEKLGIDPDGLEAEVAMFNQDAAAGAADRRFGRPASKMAAIARPPFYGYAWGQLIITTLGGLRKDGRARVLDVSGRVISRLYAAGEVASSFSWVLSGGMSLSDALAFGRIAGANAAAEPPLRGPAG